MRLPVFLFALVLLVPVRPQAVDPDKIDFTTITIWKDLRQCLQSVFYGGNAFFYPVGCATNACICRPDVLGLGLGVAATDAFSYCSDLQDQAAATSILIAYCSTRGYTSILYPTVLATTGDSRKQQKHLMGAYLFSMGEPVDMSSSGLLQAGIWNYLREEITVALECRRPVRTTLEIEFDAVGKYSDSMQANIITYLLARIMNYCFKEPGGEQITHVERLDWQHLRRDLDNWENQLPASFEIYSTAEKANNPFPSLWLFQPWHVAAQQYRFVAEILMAVSNPAILSPAHLATEYALKVCGLAFTNKNIAARVNVFGPLAFCGRFLTTSYHRKGLKTMLIDFSKPTAWPVDPIVEDLETYWNSLI